MEGISKWRIALVAAWRVVVATGLLAGVTLGGVPMERVGECLADALARSGLLYRSSALPVQACQYPPQPSAKSPTGQ
jgi:hypothetical protein